LTELTFHERLEALDQHLQAMITRVREAEVRIDTMEKAINDTLEKRVGEMKKYNALLGEVADKLEEFKGIMADLRSKQKLGLSEKI